MSESESESESILWGRSRSQQKLGRLRSPAWNTDVLRCGPCIPWQNVRDLSCCGGLRPPCVLLDMLLDYNLSFVLSESSSKATMFHWRRQIPIFQFWSGNAAGFTRNSMPDMVSSIFYSSFLNFFNTLYVFYHIQMLIYLRIIVCNR